MLDEKTRRRWLSDQGLAYHLSSCRHNFEDLAAVVAEWHAKERVSVRAQAS
jgi:hypothetical protein